MTGPESTRRPTLAGLEAIVRRIDGGQVRLAPGTRLMHDLFLDGDDAWDLLEAVRHDFGTSFRTLSFDAYFHAEPDTLLAYIAMRLGYRSRKHPLTIAHLWAVIEAGQWYDPPLQSHPVSRQPA